MNSYSGQESSTDYQLTDSVSILIVNYHSTNLLLTCLRSIYEEPESRILEVLVVDNDSTPESLRSIKENFPEIALIPQTNNLGFARAVNLAATRARGDRLLLLNPDCVVRPGALQAILNFKDSEGSDHIVGARTMFPDGSLNPYYCFNEPTLWGLFCVTAGFTALARGSRLFDPESLGYRIGTEPQRVDIVSGCCLLITTNLWRELGGFDPTFFLYGEDFDLCLRAKHIGVRTFVVPGAEIVHSGGIPSPQFPEKLIHFLRAKRLLVNRYFRPGLRSIGRRLIDLWMIRRTVTWSIIGLLGNRSAQVNARNLFEVLRRRRQWTQD